MKPGNRATPGNLNCKEIEGETGGEGVAAATHPLVSHPSPFSVLARIWGWSWENGRARASCDESAHFGEGFLLYCLSIGWEGHNFHSDPPFIRRIFWPCIFVFMVNCKNKLSGNSCDPLPILYQHFSILQIVGWSFPTLFGGNVLQVLRISSEIWGLILKTEYMCNSGFWCLFMAKMSPTHSFWNTFCFLKTRSSSVQTEEGIGIVMAL